MNAIASIERPTHVYGGNIGAVQRAIYTADGAAKPFISGYANHAIPNL